MEHLLLKHPFALALALLSFLSSSSGYTTHTGSMTYHKGPMLTGNVNLALLWYGRFDLVEKHRILSFIDSLNHKGQLDLEPSVTKWWKVVESYQSAVLHKPPPSKNFPINVRIAAQVYDAEYSSGPYLETRQVRRLLQKATNGTRNVIPVIFVSKDVRVDGICSAACYIHGVRRNTKSIYLVVANTKFQCPEKCAWPYHRGTMALQGFTLHPQSGDVGADSMLIQFASGLASVITDPMQTGFVSGGRPVQVSDACKYIFGSGAFSGYTGKIRVDPRTGGAFNAHGRNGDKFLLPAVWNPLTSSCWTLI